MSKAWFLPPLLVIYDRMLKKKRSRLFSFQVVPLFPIDEYHPPFSNAREYVGTSRLILETPISFFSHGHPLKQFSGRKIPRGTK